MNWKVRLRNPVFWVQIVVSAFAAVLAYAGLTAADLTTWGERRRAALQCGAQSVLPVPCAVERVERRQ